ncbi:MAG: flavodoxin family protein [Actinomycetota bacterium]
MRSVIVCTSVHHGNTELVARAMAGPLGAEVVPTADATAETVASADLVGFGSGIYFGKHHAALLAFTEGLPHRPDGRAFVFSTSGRGGTRFHRKLNGILGAKGYTVVGEFGCKGWDTYSIFRLIGGINRGRPNEADLADAAAFARSLA